jgi:hypothetical protein
MNDVEEIMRVKIMRECVIGRKRGKMMRGRGRVVKVRGRKRMRYERIRGGGKR